MLAATKTQDSEYWKAVNFDAANSTVDFHQWIEGATNVAQQQASMLMILPMCPCK